jgi:kynurenine formamidase
MTQFIDLTIPLAPGVGHPMFRKVQIAPFHLHEIHHRSNADLFVALHTGTHVDAPYHFFPGGTSIDQIALDQLIGKGVLMRVESIAQAGHRFSIAELKTTLRGEENELQGKMAVIATGWANLSFADESRYFRESPTLSPEAAQWLADKGVKAVVLDCATDAAEPVPVNEQAVPVHRTLLGRGVLIVENCRDLIKIPERYPFTLYAVPLKIRDESGAPARVFAVIEDR